MTVGATGQKFAYAGDGVTTGFPFPRPFFDDASLLVILIDAAGSETVQTLGVDYSVTAGFGSIAADWQDAVAYGVDAAVSNGGAFYLCTSAHTAAAATEPGTGADWQTVWARAPAANGGQVQMNTAPLPGSTLFVTRRTDLKQDTTYDPNGSFPALAHETALDRLTAIAQDLEEQIGRSVRLPESTDGSAPLLPKPEAGKLIGWGAQGNDFVNLSGVAVGAGSITNVELGDMAAGTLKGRPAGSGTGQPQDLTAAQVKSALELPTASVDNTLPRFDGTSGNLQASGVVVDDGNNVSGVGSLTCEAFTSTGIDDNATKESLQLSDGGLKLGSAGAFMSVSHAVSDQGMTYSGGINGLSGGNMVCWGPDTAPLGGDIWFRSSTTLVLEWDQSEQNWDYQGRDIVNVGGGGLRFSDDGAANPKIIWDGAAGTDYLRYSGNTWQWVIGSVTQYQMDATSFNCGVNGRNDLGTASIAFNDVYGVNAYTATSDQREKTRIRKADLGLDFIRDLRPVKFKWKKGGPRRKDGTYGKGVRDHYGLLAQDVKRALLNAGIPDAGIVVQEDTDDADSKLGLRTMELIPIIIRAVQELAESQKALNVKAKN